MERPKPTTIEEYIAAAPEAARPHLRQLHMVLKEVAPDAKEAIKWGAPVYEEKRILFSISAHKTHANFMPTGSSLKPFAQELEGWITGAETIQFPYEKPLPLELIRKIATHRRQDVLERGALWMG